MVAAAQTWMAATATWSQAHEQVLLQEEQALIAVTRGIPVALEFSATNKSAAGATWANSWGKARHLQLDEVRAAADNLQSEPPQLPPELASTASLLRVQSGARVVHQTQVETVQTGLSLADETIGLAQKAAAGDVSASDQLRYRRFDIAAAVMKNENATMKASMTMLDPGDPEGDIIKAATNTNLAMIAYLQLQKELTSGGAPDRASLIDAIRQNGEAAESAAKQAELDGPSSLAESEANPQLAGTELLARSEKAGATYEDSANVEKSLAEIVVAVAKDLANGDAPNSPAISAKLASVGQLVQRRIELDQARKQIMAGQSQ
jgi:hypothetical protein